MKKLKKVLRKSTPICKDGRFIGFLSVEKTIEVPYRTRIVKFRKYDSKKKKHIIDKYERKEIDYLGISKIEKSLLQKLKNKCIKYCEDNEGCEVLRWIALPIREV